MGTKFKKGDWVYYKGVALPHGYYRVGKDSDKSLVTIDTRLQGKQILWEVPVSKIDYIIREKEISSNKLKKGNFMNTVKDLLKSPKLRLYERHILDGRGQIDLEHPIVQEILLKVLETHGLEDRLKDEDSKLGGLNG